MNLNILNNFEQALIEGEKSPRTVAGYVGDMQLFARWFHETNGEELAPANLTSTDVKQYRSWLQITQKAAPKTINHRLADRKSTRLNSSHQLISYAVFCLKKKKR